MQFSWDNHSFINKYLLNTSYVRGIVWMVIQWQWRKEKWPLPSWNLQFGGRQIRNKNTYYPNNFLVTRLSIINKEHNIQKAPSSPGVAFAFELEGNTNLNLLYQVFPQNLTSSSWLYRFLQICFSESHPFRNFIFLWKSLFFCGVNFLSCFSSPCLSIANNICIFKFSNAKVDKFNY